MKQVEQVLGEIFPPNLLLGVGWQPAAQYEQLLEWWEHDVPADARRMLRDLSTTQSLRRDFLSLNLSLVGYWAEESDISEFFELPEQRYLVIAEHNDDPVYWAIDVKKTKPLVEITWLDGNDELRNGPATFRGLLDDRLGFLEEVLRDDTHVSERERSALQRLTAWIRG